MLGIMRKKTFIFVFALLLAALAAITTANYQKHGQIRSRVQTLNASLVADARFTNVRARGGRVGLLWSAEWFEMFGYVSSSNDLADLHRAYPFSEEVAWHVLVKETNQ
jgi:hypothetical protein